MSFRPVNPYLLFTFSTHTHTLLHHNPTGHSVLNQQDQARTPLSAMAPANRAWIRSKMAAIKKASGIAFSEEIFLSILICLTAKNKHLVLHTTPEAVPELKSTAEQVTWFFICCSGYGPDIVQIALFTSRKINWSYAQ